MGVKLDDQKGLTLLEVLLAIVLLFIVLASFAGFFTQSAMFVKKNEEKLSISQTAQQIVNLIELNLKKSELAAVSDCAALPCTLENEELSTLIGSTAAGSYSISTDFSPGEEGLIQVKVTVTDTDNPKSSSVTFTYIRR